MKCQKPGFRGEKKNVRAYLGLFRKYNLWEIMILPIWPGRWDRWNDAPASGWKPINVSGVANTCMYYEKNAAWFHINNDKHLAWRWKQFSMKKYQKNRYILDSKAHIQPA